MGGEHRGPCLDYWTDDIIVSDADEPMRCKYNAIIMGCWGNAGLQRDWRRTEFAIFFLDLNGSTCNAIGTEIKKKA